MPPVDRRDPPAARRVLVVDDSPVVRNRLRSLLAEMPGVRVVGEAEGVADAVAAIRLSRPDAVILDVRLKNGTGLDVLERVRDLAPQPRVVLLTNYDQQEYRDAARALGAVHFLDKSREFDRVAEALGLAPADPVQSGARGADERWQALIEHSTDIIIVIDRAGRMSFASPAASAILGYDPGENLGREFLEFVHRDDQAHVAAAFAELLAGAETARREARVQRQDGGWLWVEATASNRLEDPRVNGVVLNVRDVSERRHVLDALRAQVRREEAIARLGQRALAHGGLDALFADVGRALCEVLDVEYAQVLALDPDGAVLRLVGGWGWPAGVVGQWTVATGPATHAGYALATGEPVVVLDLETENRFAPPALPREHGVVSAMACVIGGAERPYGVLGVDARRRRAFTATDVSFLQTVANLLATAVARHASESATRAREAEYRLLMDSASDAIILYDADLRIQDGNERACELAGCTRAELLGRSLFDTLTPAEMAVGRARIALVRERGHLLFERPFLRRDGTVIPVEVHARLLPDGRYLSLVRDVTERRRLEERFRIVAETTADGIWEHDLATGGVWWSDNIFALAGYAPGELDPSDGGWMRAVHPDDRERVRRELTDAVRGTASRVDHEYRALRRDGSVAYVEGRARIVRDAAGAPVRIIGAVTDVTERRRADERARRVAEATNDGIWSWDAASGEGWWSDKFATLLGYRPGELVPTSDEWRRLIHPEDRERVVQSHAAWVAGPAAQWDEEYRMVRQDGTVLWIRDRAQAVRGDDGAVTSVVGALTDVTQQRRMEVQFRLAQRLEAVGRLAGGVAHDFNNILSAIMGYGQLLQEDLAGGSPRPEDLDEILRAAGRARDLTRQLLAFSRQQVLDLRVLELNDVVTGVRNMLGRLLGEDVDLALRLEPDAGRVRADAGQLEQVIVNLAVNARDAMPGGGRLTIETSAADLDADYARTHEPLTPGPYVRLAVTDTGAGMTPEVRARVFEPFFTTKGPQHGTGLGLATVYGIVKQLGGFIWVYSEPAQGTTFTIYLPRSAAAADPAPPLRPPAVTGGRETILLVEDDAAVRASTAERLRRLGYRVLAAARGDEALALAASQAAGPHLLLTDVVLPDLQGPALARMLVERRRDTRVLYVSGYADRAIVRHGLLDDGANFLQKPVAPDVLARKIREILDK